jgi:hypothetical protein
MYSTDKCLYSHNIHGSQEDSELVSQNLLRPSGPSAFMQAKGTLRIYNRGHLYYQNIQQRSSVLSEYTYGGHLYSHNVHTEVICTLRMYIQRSSVLSECTTEVICTLRMYIQRSSVLSEYTYRGHLYSQNIHTEVICTFKKGTYRGHLYSQNVFTYRGHLYSQNVHTEVICTLKCTFRGHLHPQNGHTEVICTLRMYIQRSSVLSEYTYRDHLYSQEGYIQRSSVLSECTYRGHLYYQNVLEVI